MYMEKLAAGEYDSYEEYNILHALAKDEYEQECAKAEYEQECAKEEYLQELLMEKNQEEK